MSSSEDQGSSNTEYILAGVFSGLTIIALVIGAVLYVCKIKKARSTRRIQVLSASKSGTGQITDQKHAQNATLSLVDV